MEVVIAKDGVEAVKLSLEVKPDLIIMDIMMPEMDGIQATAIIKEEPNTASIPIVAMTATIMAEKDAKVGNVQFDGFIYKPVTVSRLLEEIKRFIPVIEYKELKRGKRLTKHIDVTTIPNSLKEQLMHEVFPLITKLKVAVKGNSAEELSNLLIVLGEKYEIDSLKEKGRSFKEAVECFDILKINEYVEQLEKWIIELTH